MYPRAFMEKKDALTILFDSQSLDSILPTSSRRSKALLKYTDIDLLRLLRSPGSVKNEELKAITEFERQVDTDGSLHSIRIQGSKYTSEYAFGYRRQYVEETAKVVLRKNELELGEIQATELVFVQATLNRPDPFNILVTGNDVLLKNRLWFESHFPGVPLNIMTLEEAVGVVDLFLKQNDTYRISNIQSVNRGYWYWLCFRTKVPFYHVTKRTKPFEKSFLDAFSQRFVFLLMSVDELGFQYYSGVNNDTMDDTVYHFNYFISLVSGIFDSLALHTCNQLGLVFKGSDIPSRVSLYKKSGKDFLKAIGKKDPRLRRHISLYAEFINAVPILRERVLHREGLQETKFAHSDGWEANLIRIPNEFVKRIGNFGDTKENCEPWTEFGVYANSFLVPYQFAKTGALIMSKFCNIFLQLLGFTNFIEQLEKNRPEDEFSRTIRLFDKDNLGL